MVVGEQGWCARILAQWKARGKGKLPARAALVSRRKTDWCPVCDREREFRLIVNLGHKFTGGVTWKAWACQQCDVVRQEAG